MTIHLSQQKRLEVTHLLRQCIECGLCLSSCATWLESGNEVLSPRGRLLVLGAAISQENPLPTKSFMMAMDSCIGCHACETACPSGVPFSLLELGQKMSVSVVQSGHSSKQALPGFMVRKLDSIAVLRALGAVGSLGRQALELVAGKQWRSRLNDSPMGLGKLVRLLGTVPHTPPTNRALYTLLDSLGSAPDSSGLSADLHLTQANPDSEPNVEVLFFSGCANAGLLPATSARLIALLQSAGCRVTVPPDQECCGALAAHTGLPARAVNLQGHNEAQFGLSTNGKIVVEAAGCGLELKTYSENFAARVIDASCLLAELKLPALGSVPLRAVIHDPCHARHGQGILAETRALLAQIPNLEILEADESDVCCGSGGVWSLRYPELAQNIGLRKAKMLARTGADLVVTTNPGCLGQIADAIGQLNLGLPIIPLSDLLWYAAICGK